MSQSKVRRRLNTEYGARAKCGVLTKSSGGLQAEISLATFSVSRMITRAPQLLLVDGLYDEVFSVETEQW